jgi:hypothetical protein
MTSTRCETSRKLVLQAQYIESPRRPGRHWIEALCWALCGLSDSTVR